MSSIKTSSTDYLLAGGGLQNCLIALLLLDKDPETRVTLVEQGPELGGNHTWSFHASDVPANCRAVLAPVVQYRWPAYYVLFHGVRRRVRCGYQTIFSSHLRTLLEARFALAPNASLRLNTPIHALNAEGAVLPGGERISGRFVIDGRGSIGAQLSGGTGYQKFVGLELDLEQPGPFDEPVLMDARVPQDEGFRFFYVLPFARDRILIEDTCFSNDPDLDVPQMREAVLRYAKQKGLRVRSVLRTETGVLPMPWTMRPDWPASMPLAGGYRGGFCHPATGYSFPVALRLAKHIADQAPESPFGGDWGSFLREHQRQYRFATFLNRLLFTAYGPEERHYIFERFYRMPEAAIERFYRLELTAQDRARMFLGPPPRGISIQRMLKGAPQL